MRKSVITGAIIAITLCEWAGTALVIALIVNLSKDIPKWLGNEQ